MLRPLSSERSSWTFLLALFVSLASVAPASASTLETWRMTSEHVDIETARLGVSVAGRNGYPKIPRDALRVNVLLPDGYDPAHPLPVLYLLHGGGWGYDYWADPEGGDISEVVGDLPAIIVMPEGGRGWYTNWWNAGRRGDPAWERFHLDDLIRVVHERLAVRPERRWHAIAGFSMGGLGALNYAAQRPGYFGSAASLSGIVSIQRPETATAFDSLSAGFSGFVDGPTAQPETHTDVFGDPGDQAFYWAGHNPVALAVNLRQSRIFLTSGDGSPYSSDDLLSSLQGTPVVGLTESYMRDLSRDFASAASTAGVQDLTVNERAGLHTNFASRLGLTEALDWGLFEPVLDRTRFWTYRTVAQRGQMWQLSFAFDRPPDELIEFERRGKFLIARGSGRVRIRRGRLGRCAVSAELPFQIRFTRICSRRGH